MSDLSDWIEAQSLGEIARFAQRPLQELRQVIVTDTMKDAAMDYIHSLYDPLMSDSLLEDIFRIMAVLQPKRLECPEGPSESLLTARQET